MINKSFIPRYCFLTSGIGVHREKLASFEAALRDASIANYNLVTVSSIFPPGCEVIPRERGLEMISPGEVVFTVLARTETNEPQRRIASSIGLAIPKDPDHHGYLSEHHGYGQDALTAGEYAEDLAAQMLATIFGVEFDPDESYDNKKEIWRISGKIVSTTNMTQASVGHEKGLWTTVVAACVLILNNE